MSPLKLYYSPISTPSRAVLMAIRNMNVDVEVVTLNLGTGEHKSAEFAKINPRMCVPTIVDDDFVLCESKAILMYLPHKMGMCKGRAFYPKCARQRALVHQRLLFDSVDFYPNISNLVNLSFSDEPILTVKHKAAIVAALNVMETQFLNNGDFFVGNSATIADFAFCSSVAALIAIGFNINDDYPKLLEWYERMGTLKGFNELSAGAQQTGAMVRKGLKNSFDDL
ncbi:glutathione S-transferase 1-1-like [Chironomus tepperi]|uniref:glutathione S-transferase 1-1-like n=1 Tax=Chironomus tepperi TaxID=113505 RepID=UPI00391F3B31